MTEFSKNPRNLRQKFLDLTLVAVQTIRFVIQDWIVLIWGRRTWNPRLKPLISIIIPTRNRWEMLKERAIPSMLNQVYKNWELILVDDGSQISMSFDWQNDSRVKFYRIEKKYHYPKNAWCGWCAGPVRALNFALSKVKGDYILRMDDDDELRPTALEELLYSAQFLDAEYVSAAHTACGEIVSPYIMQGQKIGGIQTTLMRSYLKGFKYNPDCWRKKWNSPNELDLIDRMLRAGVKTIYMQKIVCDINPRPGQTEVGWKAQNVS